MAKQQILLVDSDARSARVLEVSLRSEGFNVTTAESAESALENLEHGSPDLILSDTRLPGMDGFGLVKEVRKRTSLSDVPIVFLTEQGALDDKLRGLELGVDDYLAKPIFVREVITRVHMLLARRNQQRIAAESQARTRFSGSLEDVAVVDLLQTIGVSHKSGVAVVDRGDRDAKLFFRKGQLIDASVGELRGEEAVYRIISWTKGTFDLEFREVDRATVIETPTNALLMEGLRRVDELGRLAEQLPHEDAVVDVDHEALIERLPEIPDELNGVLRLIDGKRSLLNLIDDSPFDDLSTLTVLSKFYFEGLLIVREPDPDAPESEPVAAMLSAPPGSALDESLPPTSGHLVLNRSAVEQPLRSTPLPPPPAASGRRSTRPPEMVRTSASQPSVALSEPPVTWRASSSGANAAPQSQRPTPLPPEPVAIPARVPPSSSPPPKLTPKVILNVGDAEGDRVASAKASFPFRSAGAAQPSAVDGRPPSSISNGASMPLSSGTTPGVAAGAPARLAVPPPGATTVSGVGEEGLDPGAEPESESASSEAGSPASESWEPASLEPSSEASRASEPAGEGPPAEAEDERIAAAGPEAVVSADAPPVVDDAVETQAESSRDDEAVSEPTSESRAAPASESVPSDDEADGSGTGAAPSEPSAEVSGWAPSSEAAAQGLGDSAGASEDEPAGSEASGPVSEADFFDQGDEGTYEGGPRSSIPGGYLPGADDLVHPASYHSTPAQEARVRLGTRVVVVVLALAMVPATVAVWRKFGAVALEGPGEVGSLASDQPAAELSEPAATVVDPGHRATPSPVSSTPGATPDLARATGAGAAPEAVGTEGASDHPTTPPGETTAAAAGSSATSPDPTAVTPVAAPTSPAAGQPGVGVAMRPQRRRTAKKPAVRRRAVVRPRGASPSSESSATSARGTPPPEPIERPKPPPTTRRVSGRKPPTASFPIK